MVNYNSGLITNLERCSKIVDSWPQWKKDFARAFFGPTVKTKDPLGGHSTNDNPNPHSHSINSGDLPGHHHNHNTQSAILPSQARPKEESPRSPEYDEVDVKVVKCRRCKMWMEYGEFNFKGARPDSFCICPVGEEDLFITEKTLHKRKFDIS